MKDALLMLFGAILAILGGFFNQLYQSLLNQRSKDRELLNQAIETLIEIHPIVDDLTAAREELIEPSKKLLYIVMRIRSKRYRKLSSKMVEFSKMDIRKTRQETINLILEIAAIDRSPLDTYHKKLNEMVKEAWEELKRIGKG